MPETSYAGGDTMVMQTIVQSYGPSQALFIGRDLNFQSTSDQALEKMFTGTKYVPTKILACRKSGGATVACLGGIYTGAGKTGNAIVSALQVWLGLSAAGKIVDATLAGLLSTDFQSASSLYLSLTTGSLTAVTADLFVFGVIVD